MSVSDDIWLCFEVHSDLEVHHDYRFAVDSKKAAEDWVKAVNVDAEFCEAGMIMGKIESRGDYRGDDGRIARRLVVHKSRPF